MNPDDRDEARKRAEEQEAKEAEARGEVPAPPDPTLDPTHPRIPQHPEEPGRTGALNHDVPPAASPGTGETTAPNPDDPDNDPDA